jgi:regulator of protease activity HflC (stomatin/prohibitin superfamily)
MMRKPTLLTFAALLLCGCGATIEPGHRGLLFDERHGGLQHEVLDEGWHRLRRHSRIEDYDVTYANTKETVHTISSEGLGIDIRVSLRYRPIAHELYNLVTEIGPKYYDEVVGPEFRTATRGVFARHSYLEIQRINEKLENEIEDELRRRVAGQHVEISSVTMEEVSYGPDITSTIRAKVVGEQDALRRKQAQSAEQDRLRDHDEAELRRKQAEHRIADEQASIDKVQAETESQVRVTRAKAEAQAISILAKAHAEERHAESTTLTPLMVQLHAYDALAKLGGTGTQIMLGDWSRVPSFLFPGMNLSLGASRRAASAP